MIKIQFFSEFISVNAFLKCYFMKKCFFLQLLVHLISWFQTIFIIFRRRLEILWSSLSFFFLHCNSNDVCNISWSAVEQWIGIYVKVLDCLPDFQLRLQLPPASQTAGSLARLNLPSPFRSATHWSRWYNTNHTLSLI